jgi:hypothetical protein
MAGWRIQAFPLAFLRKARLKHLRHFIFKESRLANSCTELLELGECEEKTKRLS